MEGRIRGESLSTRPRGTSELAGVADRAGSIVRDQISSMTEAARSTAADIERTARDSADDTRREAVESAVRTVGNINQVERELTLLLRGVSQEADGLRAKLDRVRLRSSPPREPAGRLEVAGGAPTTEARLLSPGLGQAQDPPADTELEVEAESALSQAGAEDAGGDAEGEALFPYAEGEPALPEPETESVPVSTEQTPEGESAAESLVEAGPEGASELDSEGEGPGIAELDSEGEGPGIAELDSEGEGPGIAELDSEGEGPGIAELDSEGEGPAITVPDLEEPGAETVVSPDSMGPSDPRTPDETLSLRGKLERLLLPSAPVRDSDGRFEVAGAEVEAESALARAEAEGAIGDAEGEALLPDAEREPALREPETEPAPVSTEAVAQPPVAEAAVEAPSEEGSPEAASAEAGEEEKSEQTAEDLMDPSDRRTPDEGREERALAGLFGGAGSSPTVDEDVLLRLAEKSDLALGELYAVAANRAAASANDEDHVYWVSLVRATVEESLARPDFGRPPPGGPSGGRKAKKRRAKALNPLTVAREEALAQRGENAGPR